MFRDMDSKMMIFQNNRVREGWIVVLGNGCVSVLLNPLYIEQSM